MKLYEVNLAIEDIFERMVDPETGEIIGDDALMEELAALQMERGRILEYLAKLVLNKSYGVERANAVDLCGHGNVDLLAFITCQKLTTRELCLKAVELFSCPVTEFIYYLTCLGSLLLGELAELFEVTVPFMHKALCYYKYGTIDTNEIA